MTNKLHLIITTLICLTVTTFSLFPAAKTTSKTKMIAPVDASGMTDLGALAAATSPTAEPRVEDHLAEVELGALGTQPATLTAPPVAQKRNFIMRPILWLADRVGKLPRVYILLSIGITQCSAISLIYAAGNGNHLVPDEFYRTDAIMATSCNMAALAVFIRELKKNNNKLWRENMEVIRKNKIMKLIYQNSGDVLVLLVTFLGQAGSLGQLVDWGNGAQITHDKLYLADAVTNTTLNLVILTQLLISYVKTKAACCRTAAEPVPITSPTGESLVTTGAFEPAVAVDIVKASEPTSAASPTSERAVAKLTEIAIV